MSNVIVGTGSYLPKRVLWNAEIEAMHTNYEPKPGGIDAWIQSKHGAVSRHRAAPGEATSDMALEAARRALADADLSSSALDLIVLVTFTGDQRLPQAAGQLQAQLSTKAKFIQVDSGCSGFVDAMLVATGLMNTHAYNTALVVGGDVLSLFNDPQSFLPTSIFGDGAGAVILQQRSDLPGYGVQSIATGSDGDLGHYVSIKGGGSRYPLSEEIIHHRNQYIRYEFPHIYTWGVDRMVRCTHEALRRADIGLDDVKWVVPHQASMNIIREVARRLELPLDRFITTYAHTGNTSSASIPIALDEANQQRHFADGDWLVMPAAGAGMAWGAIGYRWYDYRRASVRRTREGA